MRPAIAPYLTVTPAMAAIAFYTNVFGAEQLALDGGAIMLADACPEVGQTRVPIPGELSTTSVSLEFETGADIDAIFDRPTLPIALARHSEAAQPTGTGTHPRRRTGARSA